jgi:cytochrome c oxidase assembly factor CtaG
MQWWCAATDVGWNWAWRPYPGVWLFVLVVGWVIRKNVRLESPENRRTVWAGLGLASIWIALDWPVGTLGAGYLLSAHQLQYVLLVMVAPPLLWLSGSVPSSPASLRPMVVWLARPVPAILVCNAIVVLTHLPSVVESFMPTQIGSFALDVSWLVAGLILWRPVADQASPRPLSYPARFGYLLAATLIPGVPSAFFFFANFPIYSLYELAPPVSWMPVMQDQFVAGIIMKMGSFVITLTALSIVFYRWFLVDNDSTEIVVLPKPIHDPIAHER